MKSTRFITCLIGCSLFATGASGQQQSLYSQYIFNLYAVNPAYAGARDALSVNGSYRTQWVGFEGAPSTQNFNVHGPLRNENMALGIQFQNDRIGARKAPFLGMAYAYRIRLDEQRSKHLSMGVQLGVINYQYDWNALEYKNPGDPVAFSTDGNHWIPNIDFGMMYLGPRSYFGVSASGLQQSRLNNNDLSDARLNTFINVQGGHIVPLKENFALKPFFMLRHTWQGPSQLDLGLSALFLNQFWLGGMYRHEFGLVYSAQFVARKGLVIGYAYDMATNALRASQSGTHEVYVGIDINIAPGTDKTMRYY